MSKAENLKSVQPNVDTAKVEQEVMKFWNEKGILQKYLTRNVGAKEKFSFIDGPITANNAMGIHHAWGDRKSTV